MPEYTVSQLIEVSYTIEAPDEDTAARCAEELDWDVYALLSPYEVSDVDPYSGGTVLSVT